METYHPHGNHPKRGIKDYISEFILIFIAITGGFFMENIREHVVDRHKEKEFIIRLIRDLKEDTASLHSVMRLNRAQIIGLDSLVLLLEKPVVSIDLQKFMTLLTEDLNDFHAFTSRNITMTQLKNTGGLRLIENTAISDDIVYYYNNIDSGDLLKNSMNTFLEESFREEMTFIDFNQIFHTKQLNINDVNKLKGLGNRSYVYKFQVGVYNSFLENIYNNATSLLQKLNEEY